MHDDERTRITYRYDRLRAGALGIIETAQQTFLLLIAVRVLSADPTSKALIASGQSIGLLLSLLVVWLVTARCWKPAHTAAQLAGVGAFSFLMMTVFASLPVYVFGSVVAMASLTMAVPLMTQIYQDNYPAAERGKLFSRAVMIRVIGAAGFSALGGWLLSQQIEWYRLLLLSFGGAAAMVAFCLSRMPSTPLQSDGKTSPFRALRYVRDDYLFRWALMCWMLVGFASLMMFPLRVEYLANPRYGVSLSSEMIALYTGVIPNLARLMLSPVWGRIFDRMNFFALRVVLNIGFALGILTFFTSDNTLGFILGALIFGVSQAGGEVAWNLWVTKVAPPQRVADYMSVHTFFTGLRGVVAPLVGFHLLATFPVRALGWVNASLILLASLFLLREVKFGKSPDPGTTLVQRGTET